MIHFDKIILVGDFNLHMDDASNYSATEFLKLQKHLILCNSNFVHMSDHKCNMNKLVLGAKVSQCRGLRCKHRNSFLQFPV